MKRVLHIKFFIASFILTCIGCDSDPFSTRRVTIVTSFQLNQSEDKPYFYYLVGGKDSGGYGALESTVGKLGWNERYIVVYQTNDGLRSGWRIVDGETKNISGYLTEKDALSDPRVSGVEILSADEAWKKLK